MLGYREKSKNTSVTFFKWKPDAGLPTREQYFGHYCPPIPCAMLSILTVLNRAYLQGNCPQFIADLDFVAAAIRIFQPTEDLAMQVLFVKLCVAAKAEDIQLPVSICLALRLAGNPGM